MFITGTLYILFINIALKRNNVWKNAGDTTFELWIIVDLNSERSLSPF